MTPHIIYSDRWPNWSTLLYVTLFHWYASCHTRKSFIAWWCMKTRNFTSFSMIFMACVSSRPAAAGQFWHFLRTFRLRILNEGASNVCSRLGEKRSHFVTVHVLAKPTYAPFGKSWQQWMLRHFVEKYRHKPHLNHAQECMETANQSCTVACIMQVQALAAINRGMASN